MADKNQVQSAWKIIPHFRSDNIQTTVDFYTRVLGFTVGGIHTDDQSGKQTFCSLYAGDKAAANIYFSSAVTQSSAWIALGTAELDDFYQELKSHGNAEMVEDIADKEWGYRQFTIKDTDGNRLTFFKFLEDGNPGNGAE
ncbi:Glyoxalase/Bleomycin resistance protein/Dihydroxybiphenyl dioxygenase [Chaetomium fimeti]|uniref:Glyoxalase/Bleomycin resistance protein/Dihydroxybiphenyl dioxygenase n=1 Tax=Chaetomium fimeti TaxID=1854472 RepID=A0AAE0HG98_9PEZI|nr:Glyoxalase/Bleomycin resistance protein/Dihydroxybiphenyl dioxygenase [Chaetomium fimeti]KAK3295101.1 Glyoxalase/Bleomycin resistance protein/Dihydroxybiphenyl dioxygenase [Chaetomium fimeti]